MLEEMQAKEKKITEKQQARSEAIYIAKSISDVDHIHNWQELIQQLEGHLNRVKALAGAPEEEEEKNNQSFWRKLFKKKKYVVSRSF